MFILKIMKRAAAAILTLTVVLTAAGCGRLNISREIAKVNGRSITEAEFMYYLENVKSQMQQEAGQTADKNFWDAEIDGEKASVVAKNKALDEAIRTELACIKAEEAGLTVSEDNQKSINALLKTRDKQQKAQIDELKKITGLFDRLLKDTLTKSALAGEYYNHINTDNADAINPTDADIDKAYEADYVRVKHILISFEDASAAQQPTTETLAPEGEPAADATAAPSAEPTRDPEAVKQEKKALADSVLAKAKAGESFEGLIAEYGTDPGMTSSPDGYTFTKDGGMVAEFEAASFDLAVDAISEPVETTYGYHIIKRYPLLKTGEDYTKAVDALSKSLVEDKYNALIDSYKADYEITIKSNIVDKIKVKTTESKTAASSAQQQQQPVQQQSVPVQ